MSSCCADQRRWRIKDGYILRDELCVVMFDPGRQIPFTPLKETSEGLLGISADLYLIFV